LSSAIPLRHFNYLMTQIKFSENVSFIKYSYNEKNDTRSFVTPLIASNPSHLACFINLLWSTAVTTIG